MIISGCVIVVGCDSGELHQYAYGAASYNGISKAEAIAIARKDGWIIDIDNNHCICPLHAKQNDARYDD